jgi:hypothetical protein
LLRSRLLRGMGSHPAAWATVVRAASSPLFLAADQGFSLLRTHQSIHLLVCALAQLLNMLLLLLRSERAVAAHRLHLGVQGLANLPYLRHC